MSKRLVLRLTEGVVPVRLSWSTLAVGFRINNGLGTLEKYVETGLRGTGRIRLASLRRTRRISWLAKVTSAHLLCCKSFMQIAGSTMRTQESITRTDTKPRFENSRTTLLLSSWDIFCAMIP